MFLCEGIKLDLGQFTHPIDEIGYGITELHGERFFADPGVFDHIMQQARHDALRIHVHFSQNIGDGEWVSYVRIAASSRLPKMSLLGVKKGAFNRLALFVTEIFSQRVI